MQRNEFPIKLLITTEVRQYQIGYISLESILEDAGLRSLFDGEHVVKCEIYENGRRLAGLPFMTWERLQKVVD